MHAPLFVRRAGSRMPTCSKEFSLDDGVWHSLKLLRRRATVAICKMIVTVCSKPWHAKGARNANLTLSSIASAPCKQKVSRKWL